jgi:hypothetical protein
MAEDFDLESLAYLEQTYVLLSNYSIRFLRLVRSFFDTGYAEGHAHGRIHGLIEGRALGREKGFEMWEELGFYEGFARGWMAILQSRTSKGSENSGESVFFRFFCLGMGVIIILLFKDGRCNISATF